MKIENLNIFDRVNSAKDQSSGSASRSSQGEDQKSSKSDDAFAKLLNSNRKPIAKQTSERKEVDERTEIGDESVEASSVDANRKPIPERAPVAVPRSVPMAKTKENGEDVRSSEDIRKPSKPIEGDVSGQQLNRRVALQTFLKKMKEQLNVQPEQLMAAFSALSIEELTSPPEMNLEKIIQGLNLSEQQKPVAKQLFEDMMKQTAANSMAEQLKASGQQLSLQVLSQKEIQQQQLNQSLSKMNQNFFMAEQKPMLQNPVLAKQVPVNANGIPQEVETLNENSEGIEIPGFIPTNEEMPLMQNLSKAKMPAASSASAFSIPSLPETGSEQSIEAAAPKIAAKSTAVTSVKAAAVETVPLAAGQPATPEMLSALMPQAKVGAASSFFSNAEFEMDEEAALDVAPSSKTPQMDPQLVDKLKAALQAQSNNNENSDSQSEGDVSSQDLTLQPQADTVKNPGFDKAIASNIASKQMAPGQDSNNVKELINQAQFMIKKGGGEMKVRLTPEGLGEVTMKVHVLNGQVSVEMVTENSEAKKLIESGLGDLKATLASHKLNVDQIKVDLSQQTAKDFQQQHEQASRHQAQQFMEEFRHDNQQWRQSFYDVPGAKAYKSQTRDEADNGYLTPQSSRKSSNASRRLDLVA